MRDDPRKNLKWLEQELLASERPPQYMDAEPDPPAFVQKGKKQTKGQRAEQAHIPQFNESAALLTKTKKQLRKEARQRKTADKKSGVNRNLKDLVFLAVLEIIGILCILGWWLQ